MILMNGNLPHEAVMKNERFLVRLCACALSVTSGKEKDSGDEWWGKFYNNVTAVNAIEVHT